MLLFYGFVLLIVICQTLAQSEIPAKVVTLLSNASYVDYAPVAWNYTGMYGFDSIVVVMQL